MKVKFLGAAGTVTGSKYLFTLRSGKKVIIDFGMFQGPHELEMKNYEKLGVDFADVDAIILTHAHLDHVGLLPILARKGFDGKIIATSATYHIANIVLLDAAHLQHEEIETENKRRQRRGEPELKPLYDVSDAALITRRFLYPVAYNETLELFDDFKVTFRDAGHILGSAFLEIEAENKKIVFSGDLGNYNKPVIRDPQPIHMKDADFVFLESTYGNRNHKSIEESKRELLDAIKDTYERGGNALIPSFAIERAQDILYYLREFYEKGQLPPVKVFLDSPMAIEVTHIFKLHKECYDEEAKALIEKGKDLFSFPGLKATRSVQASKEINYIKHGAVIIAGSGMCTGGRIKHHLKHNLWREESSVIFVGYQAKGTLGRKIIDGEKVVKIYGEDVVVKAKIYTIGGFSAHADRRELLSWVRDVRKGATIFHVHGEEEALVAMKDAVDSMGYKGYIPEYREEIEI